MSPEGLIAAGIGDADAALLKATDRDRGFAA
jgi:hypothetical protein